jgi:hypothetical protein
MYWQRFNEKSVIKNISPSKDGFFLPATAPKESFGAVKVPHLLIF